MDFPVALFKANPKKSRVSCEFDPNNLSYSEDQNSWNEFRILVDDGSISSNGVSPGTWTQAKQVPEVQDTVANKVRAMNIPPVSDKSNEPLRPKKLTVDFCERADALEIVKKGEEGPWGCLLLWGIGATIVCAAILFKAFKDPSLGIFLFALMFCSGWVISIGGFLWMKFGRETFSLDNSEATLVWKVLIHLSSRVVPRKEIMGFRECMIVYRGRRGRVVHHSGIEMLTLGKPVQFSSGLPEEERAWLLHKLNSFLASSKQDVMRNAFSKEMPTEGEQSSVERPSKNGTFVATETLVFEHTLTEPPTDCRWHITENFDGFAFWQRGRLNIGNLAGAFLINGMLNGLVLIFVMGLFGMIPVKPVPQGWEWWKVFLLLIPFEFFGLVTLAILLLELVKPFRRTEWQFAGVRVIEKKYWPMYCITRVWEILDIARLELRQNNRENQVWKHFHDVTADWTNQDSFELAMVSSDNLDLCKIENLTEGEARWLARTILNRKGMASRFSPKT